MSSRDKAFDSGSEQQTLKFAKNFGKKLKGGEIIELIGDMGSGKTTFVKGLAAGAGSKNLVTSPTFTIQQIYKGRVDIYHYDFYRLHDAGILAHEISEALDRKDAVLVVEWPETINNVLPKSRIQIIFAPSGQDRRKITIKTRGSKGAS